MTFCVSYSGVGEQEPVMFSVVTFTSGSGQERTVLCVLLFPRQSLSVSMLRSLGTM